MQVREGNRNHDSIAYNESNKNQALKEIERMTADHGGTDIITPLRQAQNWRGVGTTPNERRVFILTDG